MGNLAYRVPVLAKRYVLLVEKTDALRMMLWVT